MEKKPIQAKNVVSFGDGKRPAQTAKKTESVAKPVVEQAVEEVAETVAWPDAEDTAKAANKTVVENEVSEEVPARKAPEPEAIETRPLNLRQNRFLDEEPQEPDWADEEDAFHDYEEEAEDDALSTFAEVFIPLHDDSIGAIVRKGMVIVSLIVILCCIVVIVMKQTGTGAVITPDLSALTDRAATLASVALSSL